MKKGEDGVKEPYHLLNMLAAISGGYVINLKTDRIYMIMNAEQRAKATALREQNERDLLKAAVKEYEENGGVITICEPGARTEDIAVGQWGKRRAKNKKIGPITLQKDLEKLKK